MNQLTLEIRYKPMGRNVALALCAVWFILGLIVYYTVGHRIVRLGWVAALLGWLIGGGFFIYVPFLVVSSHREGGLLVLNRDGLFMPPSFYGLGFRKTLRWKQVRAVDCDPASQKLILKGGFGGTTINLSQVDSHQLEQVLLGIEVWNPNAGWSQRAIDFRDNVQNSKIGLLEANSFTRVWEDELQRRYTATTFTPHEPGTLLGEGRYKIVRQIAFGGFSAIYLAEDENKEQYVIKELVVTARDEETRAKALQMFQREARILAGLRHDNIARVVDHFVEANRNYIVLESIDGENLRQLVRRRGPLPEREILGLSKQMLDILNYLHSQIPPLIHRDFTPDNLILAPDGRLTLVDFGAANEYASMATGTLVGKQSYMPIEQIRGKAEPPSDLYALGCTLSFLANGQDPEPLSVCRAESVNSKLAAVIQRLTQTEPEERYVDAKTVMKAIEEAAY